MQRVWRRCRAPKRQEERRESEGPVVSRSSQVNVLQLEQQSIGIKGDLVSVGWKRSGDQKGIQRSLIPPRCWQNLDVGIRKVKSGEGKLQGRREG